MRLPLDSIFITNPHGAPGYGRFGRHMVVRLWYTVYMGLKSHKEKKEESWKPVKGFEHYRISNYGCLKRLPSEGHRNTKNTLYAKGSLTRKGYLSYKLYGVNGETKTMSAHRLASTAFLDNPDNMPQVNHIDGDKTNNHIINLEWCTNYDNLKHAHKNRLIDNRGEKSGKNKYSEATVRKILEHPHNKGYRELSLKLNVPYASVKSIRAGRRWNHLWREYNEITTI